MKTTITTLLAVILFSCNTKEKAQLNYDLGLTEFSTENYNQAIDEFSTAIEIYSEYSQAYKERGTSKFMLFDFLGPKLISLRS